MIAAAIIDANTHRIPNRLIALLYLAAGAELLISGAGLKGRLAGLFFPAAVLLLGKMRQSGGIGGGDIKLISAAGLMFGSLNACAAFVTGGVICLFVEVILRKRKKGEVFAFGPYLAVGTVIILTAAIFRGLNL